MSCVFKLFKWRIQIAFVQKFSNVISLGVGLLLQAASALRQKSLNYFYS